MMFKVGTSGDLLNDENEPCFGDAPLEILKKNFYNSKEKELLFAVRVIGANISLDRYYKNVDAESVINELISISSPIEEKKIFFVWPEGIIPNTYEDQLDLYNDIFEKYFSEKGAE